MGITNLTFIFKTDIKIYMKLTYIFNKFQNICILFTKTLIIKICSFM